jgi:carbon monoxide dehydrogenase subunit G
MIIEQSFNVHAPIRTLWDYFLDVEAISLCIPGVQNVRVIGDNAYEGAFNIRVGPIGALFNGQAQFLELDPPHHLVARGEAKDERSASPASAVFTADLRSLADDQTEVVYRVEANVGGALGKFGHGVMREVARRMTADFARCVEARLAAQPAALPGAAPEPVAVAAPRKAASRPVAAAGRQPSPMITLEIDRNELLTYAGVAGIALVLGYLLGRGARG